MNMNKLNNTRKVKRNIVKSLATLCLGLLSVCFTACDDDLDVTQAYPFTVEAMPVPKELAQGETAEIRCELVREGEFDGAVYTIRYFQYDGEGTLKLDNGLVLQPNDRYLLENEKLHLGVRRVAKPDHHGGGQFRQCLRVGIGVQQRLGRGNGGRRRCV